MHRSILSALILLLFSSLCPAAERVALVIGNNAYQHMGKLTNPQRDAAAVAGALKALKFDVEIIENATTESFYEGLEKLKTRAAGAELALVYFAGHGVEIGDKNYLLPVDAELATQAQLRTQAVALDDLLADLEKTKVAAKVAILDCCRNDPLTRAWMAKRSVGVGGLAELKNTQLPSSSLVMFSAGPGQVAADGAGGNSPFTGSLVKRLSTPGQSLFDAFLGTSDDVMKVTAKQQEPWVQFDGAGRVFRDLVMLPSGGDPPQALPQTAPKLSPFEAIWRPRNFLIAAASNTIPIINDEKEPSGDARIHIMKGEVMVERDMVQLTVIREVSAISRKGWTFKDGQKKLYGLHEDRWLLSKDHLASQMKSDDNVVHDGANKGLRAAESLGLTTMRKTGWFLASPTSGKGELKDGSWGILADVIESRNPAVAGINIASHGGFLINTELGGVYGFGGGLSHNGLFFKLLDESP